MTFFKSLKKTCFVIIAVILCLMLASCGNERRNSPREDIGRDDDIVADDDANRYETENDFSQKEGTPLEFQDNEVKKCVCDSLGLADGSTITDTMCNDIKELDLREYSPHTLADLEKLGSLEKLYVDNEDNELDLKGINKPLNLNSVTLRNCKLQEVDRLADLKNLEYLDISTDSVWGNNVNDYSSLSALTNLKYLNLSWRGYNAYNPYGAKDGSFINNLTNLQELNIYETGIENYSLSNLINLKRLTISEISADQVLQELVASGAINNIEYLYLGTTCKGLSNDGLVNLSKANKLEELYFSGSNLSTLSGLGNLQNLKILYFNNDGFDIPLSAFDEIGKLVNLEALKISNNEPNPKTDGVVNPDAYKFLNTLTNVKILSIEGYDGMSIGCFKDMKSLEDLTILHLAGQAEVDIEDIGSFAALKDFKYKEMRLKSTAPLDDLDYLNVQELNITAEDKFDTLYFDIKGEVDYM